jgi:hypothetical protein
MNTLFEYDFSNKTNAKIIIYGIDAEAKYLAFRLANRRIGVDSFLYIGNEKIKRMRILNKQVSFFHDLENQDYYLIVVPYIINRKEAEAILTTHGIPADKVICESVDKNILNADKVLVYGSGKATENLIEKFGYIKIDCFLDSDINREGEKLYDISIKHPSSIQMEMKNNCVVIISSYKYYNAMYQKLIENGFQPTQIYFYVLNQFIFLSNINNGDQPNTLHFMERLCFSTYGKRVFLLGEEKNVKEYAEILPLFNIDVYKTITYDLFDKGRLIYKLAYEIDGDSYVFITNKSSIYEYNALKKIGLKDNQIWFTDCNDLYFSTSDKLLYRYGLDPNLGHTKFDMDGQPVDIIKYEYEGKDSVNSIPIKILALGGSTTAVNGVRETPWLFFFHDILQRKKIAHIIYCAGMVSYIASQELVKLIRDGLMINPDICISYTGVNNKFHVDIMEKHLFIHTYQEKLFKNMCKYQNPLFRENSATMVCFGVDTNIDAYEYLVSQIRLMHAVCNEFDIRFLAFLQPDFYSKIGCGEKDATLYSLYDILVSDSNELICDNDRIRDIKRSIMFRRKSVNIEEQYDYIHDFNDIFDGMDGIYIDDCHICEWGNQIVAKNIYSIAEKDIFEVIENQKIKR